MSQPSPSREDESFAMDETTKPRKHGIDPKYKPYLRIWGKDSAGREIQSIDWAAYNADHGIVEQPNEAADAAAERIRRQIKDRGERGWFKEPIAEVDESELLDEGEPPHE